MGLLIFAALVAVSLEDPSALEGAPKPAPTELTAPAPTELTAPAPTEPAPAPAPAPAPSAPDVVAPSAPDAAPPSPAPPAPAPAPASSVEDVRLKLISLDLKGSNVSPQDVSLLSGLLAVELGAYDALEVVSGAEVRQLVELEGEKQILGCETSTSCLAEIAGALGARLVVFGELGRLGSRYVLNLSVHDSKTNKSAGRASLQGEDIEGLADGVPEAAARLIEPFLKGEKRSTTRIGDTRIRVPRTARDASGGSWLQSTGAVTAVVGGAGFLGVYLASVILPATLGAPPDFVEAMMIPVAGPWLALGNVRSDPVSPPDGGGGGGGGDQGKGDESGILIVVGLGIGQGLFALLGTGGALAWSGAILADSPATMPPDAQAWRWGLVGGGAVAIGGGLAMDTLLESSSNRTFDVTDVVPPVLYVLGGTAAVVGLATNPYLEEGAE